MDIFTTTRWIHADWYTAGPLEALDDEALARLAEETVITAVDAPTQEGQDGQPGR